MHFGLPGQSGPMVLDIGDGTVWDDFGQVGIAKVMARAALPPMALQALVQGSAYIDIHTTNAPNGELRAQLVPIAALDVQLSGVGVRLSWPGWGSGFGLQSAETMDGPWTNMAATPTQEGDEFAVYDSPLGGSKFYRLLFH
jgi:hypothetical protein